MSIAIADAQRAVVWKRNGLKVQFAKALRRSHGILFRREVEVVV